MHAWIWIHLLVEHSCTQECVPCGHSSALPVHTKQWRGIVSLRKHRWHIQNVCKVNSKRAIYWTASGWNSLPPGCVWLSARASNTAISRCRGAPREVFFSHHFWWLLLLPRLRKDLTSAGNGDNGMLYAKRECRVRATMDGKWSQQPEITRVIVRTGSSLGSQSSCADGNVCFNLEQRYLAFTAISAWFAT